MLGRYESFGVWNILNRTKPKTVWLGATAGIWNGNTERAKWWMMIHGSISGSDTRKGIYRLPWHWHQGEGLRRILKLHIPLFHCLNNLQQDESGSILTWRSCWIWVGCSSELKHVESCSGFFVIYEKSAVKRSKQSTADILLLTCTIKCKLVSFSCWQMCFSITGYF